MDGMDMYCGNSTMSMKMFFHFSHTIPNLLFESWNICTPAQLVGAMVFSMVLAVLYEGLKSLREYLMCVGLQSSWSQAHTKHSPNTKHSSKQHISSDESTEPLMVNDTPHKDSKHWRLKHYTLTWSMHSLQSGMHIIQVGLGYILMLLAMTYNGWLFLSVAVGAGIGYFVFARVRHLSSPFREQQDHCN